MYTFDQSRLVAYGWDERWAKLWEGLPGVAAGGLRPARVALQHAHRYMVWTGDEPGDADEEGKWAEVSRRMAASAVGPSAFPSVGDWVCVRPGNPGEYLIEGVMPRRSSFSRRAAGSKPEEQVVAANADVVLIVTSAVYDFNPGRLERYMVVAWESGASPVVVISKADLHYDIEAVCAEASAVATPAPVISASCVSEGGLDGLTPYLRPGSTLALLGSSGVGKSTILNKLMKSDVQRVNGLRVSDGKGRHTTTHRQLFLVCSGCLVIDTPGMREIQMWDVDDGLRQAFPDIDELAAACRFRDCRHSGEPGCAVSAAVASGHLDKRRLKNYISLARGFRPASGKLPARKQRRERRPRLDDVEGYE